MITAIARVCKNVLLPAGRQYRKLRFGPAAGCMMQIDFRHNTKLYFGLYEIELMPHFRALVQEGMKCFDVGGQGGYDALLVAKRTHASVVSFECDPKAAEGMRETFARNPSFDIKTIEAFVGDQNDAQHITLDRAAEQTFVPDFIKLDIEGAEADALQGAQHILATRQPSLIIEVHGADVEAQCVAILTSYGYEPRIVNQRKLFPDRRPLAHNRWLVCKGKP